MPTQQETTATPTTVEEPFTDSRYGALDCRYEGNIDPAKDQAIKDIVHRKVVTAELTAIGRKLDSDR